MAIARRVGGSDARYLPTGHLLYAMNDALMAVPFDLRRLEVTGGPVPMAGGVRRAAAPGANSGTANYGLSKTGMLAYVAGEGAAGLAARSLVWVDRAGRAEPVAQAPQRAYVGPRLARRPARGVLDGGCRRHLDP